MTTLATAPTISASLAKAAGCRRRLALQAAGYTRPEPEESLAAAAGTALHEAAHLWLLARPQQAILEHVEALLGQDPGFARQAPSSRLATPNILAVLETWLLRHPRGAFPWRPVEIDVPAPGVPGPILLIEVAFRIPLRERPGGPLLAWLEGRPDAIVAGQDSRLLPLDWKSTSYPGWFGSSTVKRESWRAQQRRGLQLRLYALALRELIRLGALGAPEPSRSPRAVLYVIHLDRIPVSASKCPEHGEPYRHCGPRHLHHDPVEVALPDLVLDETHRHLVGLARRLSLLSETAPHLIPADGALTGDCQTCPFEAACDVAAAGDTAAFSPEYGLLTQGKPRSSLDDALWVLTTHGLEPTDE